MSLDIVHPVCCQAVLSIRTVNEHFITTKSHRYEHASEVLRSLLLYCGEMKTEKGDVSAWTVTPSRSSTSSVMLIGTISDQFLLPHRLPQLWTSSFHQLIISSADTLMRYKVCSIDPVLRPVEHVRMCAMKRAKTDALS